jgi:hypothetical protein
MPFIMIVVTTSCAPVLTLRMPGIKAHSIPASIAARMINGMRMKEGGPSSRVATAAAATSETMYWPSTPMLNIPALKATATASPEKISGVAISRTRAMSENSEVEKTQIVR